VKTSGAFLFQEDDEQAGDGLVIGRMTLKIPATLRFPSEPLAQGRLPCEKAVREKVSFAGVVPSNCQVLHVGEDASALFFRVKRRNMITIRRMGGSASSRRLVDWSKEAIEVSASTFRMATPLHRDESTQASTTDTLDDRDANLP
jgi:hypothetical protein